jgi:hypothetical protein
MKPNFYKSNSVWKRENLRRLHMCTGIIQDNLMHNCFYPYEYIPNYPNLLLTFFVPLCLSLLFYCRPPITPSQVDGSLDAEKSASESSQQGTEAVAASAEFSAAEKKKTTEEEKESPTSGRENWKNIGENNSLSFNCIWY